MKSNLGNISDREIRDLLNQLLISEQGNSSLKDKLIDMETSIQFGHAPMVAVIQKPETFRQWTNKLKYKSMGKWLLGVVLGTSVVLGGYQALKSPNEAPKQGSVLAIVDDQKRTETKEEKTSIEKDHPRKKINEKETVSSQSFQISETYPVLPYKNAAGVEYSQNQSSLLPLISFSPQRPEKVISNGPEESFKNIRKIIIESEMCEILITSNRAEKEVQVQHQLAEFKDKDIHFEYSSNLKGETLYLQIDLKYDRKKRRIKFDRDQRAKLAISMSPNIDLDIKNDIGLVDLRGIVNSSTKIDNNFGNIELRACESQFELDAESGQCVLTECSGQAKIDNNFGSVTMEQFNGPVSCEMNSGKFNAKSLHGDLQLKNEFGSSKLEGIQNERTSIQCKSGHLTLGQIESKTIDLKAGFGNLHLYDAKGKLKIEGNSGQMRLERTVGDTEINCEFGKVEVKQHQGNMTIEGGSGKIQIHHLIGNLSIDSDFSKVELSHIEGNLQAELNTGSLNGTKISLKDNAKIYTTFGNVDLQLENELKDLKCKLNSHHGKINLEKGDQKFSRGSGSINLGESGSIDVLISTESGSINLR